MFKFAGCILIMGSTTFLLCQKVFEYYFTYKFLYYAIDIIVKIQYENGANMTYAKVYERIDFDYPGFFTKAKINGYIKRNEIETVHNFFKNLGKRDKNGEKEYIEYNLKLITAKAKYYSDGYNRIKKSHFMCGMAMGLIIIIFFI